MEDKAVQTKDRIYTFPIPMPTTLTSESVSWGEPEIKTAVMSPGELWHARLGHPNDMCMKDTSDKYPMFNIPKKQLTNINKQSETCECCARCKATVKRKVKSSYHRATRYLERVHMDVCGPLQMKTYDGCQYFTVFIDEYTGYRWVYVHKDRSTSIDILRRFLLDATKGTDLRVECLRVDQAGEHLSKAYRDELVRNSIRMECSCSYDHFQNGRAEKVIRDICSTARCMLEYGKVARDMWGYAVRYAVYVQNRIVHANMEMAPYEMRYGEAPDLSRLKVFGCAAYVARDKKETDFVKDSKLDMRGTMGCFVGIAEDGGDTHGAAVKGYIVWALETGARVITSTQVRFDETRYPRLIGITEWEFSMQTRVQKCRATITDMSFETEELEKHPFMFDEEELDYRLQQHLKKLNPEHLVGLKVMVNVNGNQREGIVYSYVRAYKVWNIVLTADHDDESPYVYVTLSQLADENKVMFREKFKIDDVKSQKTKDTSKQKYVNKDIDLNYVKLQREIDILHYDKSMRETQEVVDRVVHARAVKTKAPPITRHEPEPKTWSKAMNSKAAEKWYKASEDEVNGLDTLKTWEVSQPMPGIIPIESKWVFKIKYNPDGTVDKYKARLVVRGDSQRAGLDYGEVFSPVAHNTICRMLLSMANACDFYVDLVDVCQAFLNAPLEEEIYMKPAPGVTQILGIPEGSWLKLKRNLYGLKQAPRNWSLTFIDWMMKDQGFSKASIDDCLFYKEFKHNGKDVFILLLMYVDDNIIISNDRKCLNAFKEAMHDKFKIVDKQDIKTYLGVQIERDKDKGTLKMHQEGYLNEVLAAMGIKSTDTLTYPTPLPANVMLTKNTGDPYELDLYRSAIGSLIYLSQWTRIDIAYAVSALAAHMSNPSRDHHVALKHLLHYLHGTRDKGIVYHKYDVHGINKIYGFVDADYAGERDTRKSRSGYVIMMNSGAISWKSKLQTVVANSTTDAEVYAATVAIKEIVYLRDALRRIGLPQAVEGDSSKGTILYEDNEATTAIARTAAHREATKHMAIARSFLRYHQENGTVHFVDCYTSMQVADFLTKPLGNQTFGKLVSEAMGDKCKDDIAKYSRRNWKEKYEEGVQLRLKEKENAEAEKQIHVDHVVTSSPNDAQGGMLKYEFVDLIYCNCMRVTTNTNGQCMTSADMDEYLSSEQHRLNVVNQVIMEDMKVENKYYGGMVVTQRVPMRINSVVID